MTVEERIRLRREEKLIQLGFCTRMYNPDEADEGNANLTYDDDEGHEYPEFDRENNQHFRYVVDDVTDEQFQKILATGGGSDAHASNNLADILTVLAWIAFIIILIAGGIVGANTGYRGDFNFGAFLVYAGFGAGALLSLLWFAEVLNLLQGIRDKL